MTKKLTLEKRQNLIGWAILLPATLLIFIFCFYPMLQAILLSFKRGNNASERWVGFQNYTRLFKDKVFLESNIHFYYNKNYHYIPKQSLLWHNQLPPYIFLYHIHYLKTHKMYLLYHLF